MAVTDRSRSRKKSLRKRASKKIQAAFRKHQNYVPPNVTGRSERLNRNSAKRRLSDHKEYQRLVKMASQPRTYDQMRQAAFASGMIGSGSSPASLRARLTAVGNRLSQKRR